MDEGSPAQSFDSDKALLPAADASMPQLRAQLRAVPPLCQIPPRFFPPAMRTSACPRLISYSGTASPVARATHARRTPSIPTGPVDQHNNS